MAFDSEWSDFVFASLNSLNSLNKFNYHSPGGSERRLPLFAYFAAENSVQAEDAN